MRLSLISDPPKVTLHARIQAGLAIKKGDEIKLDAFISGSPYPTVTWLRNDKSVQQIAEKKVEIPIIKKKKKGKEPEPEPEEFHPPLPDRLSFDQSKRGETAMMVRDSIRGDHGKYTIVVENQHGVAKASCEVNVQGKKVKRHIQNKPFLMNFGQDYVEV